MPATENKSYSQHLKEIDKILHSLERCDDVDSAVDLFEQGKELLTICKTRLEDAKQRFENINNNSS